LEPRVNPYYLKITRVYHSLLNNYEFSGRTLRVDFAETEKQNMQAAAAAGAIQQPGRGPQPGRPPVIPITSQSGSASNPETIGNYLEGMSSAQLYENVAKMKILVQQNPDQARQLLLGNPHLAYALLQAQYLLGMIKVQTVQKLLAKVTVGSSPAVITPPMAAVNIPPMMNQPMMAPTFQPPVQPFLPPVQPFQPPSMKSPAQFQPPQQIPQQYITQAFGDVQLAEQQKELLQQVVNLTPEQIDVLPLEQRQQVQQLRQTLLGGFAQPPLQQWR